ncbi:hypothetical protein [Streptomyces justiciae]|uniref:hypothetical protein n=1 Tax=Streptomyces justiciae TaxID=2780140 RepID=UPI0018805C9A|nr:hypothetical protein [Streptomyces justiciae]MBE8472509.1 hypothetical protein [Streptomyces justiciae]MCW8381452.1 hypothetical protein [Streptomyces justiciae]
MRRSTFAPAALLTFVLAGCGSQAGSDGSDGSDTMSPSPPSSSCTTASELNASDSGDTVCLAVGDTVRVGLDGTKSRPWKPVTTEGTGLEAGNSGIVLLPGDANAAYQAVSAGTVRLTSSRPLCATETGKVSCKGVQDWSVTVVITSG